MADIKIIDQGTIIIFTAVSESAQEWLEYAMPAEARWTDKSWVVEHRFAPDIIEDLVTVQGYEIS